jgi:hypothetical protein
MKIKIRPFQTGVRFHTPILSLQPAKRPNAVAVAKPFVPVAQSPKMPVRPEIL